MKSTVLEDYVFVRDGLTGSKYDQYLDGRVHRIETVPAGSDFRNALYRRATKQGVKIRTHAPEPGVLVVQAYKPNAS